MGGPGPVRDGRRSSRIALSVPVEVPGYDASGAEIREKATTNFVNKHGANILLQHRFSIGTEIGVSIPHLERQQKCRVAWIGEEAGEKGKYETGVELERAENFWSVQFPPEDWVALKQVPLAGHPSGPILSPSQTRDNEQQIVRDMLNALVSVLEEKGVVSRAELAEMLKRRS